MRVLPDQPMILLVEYWGGFPGNKTFNIFADETLLATENISNIKDGQWVVKKYDIPAEVTADKARLTVRFQAFYGHMAGPVFGVRTIKQTNLP
jgi:hypothetical protein